MKYPKENTFLSRARQSMVTLLFFTITVGLLPLSRVSAADDLPDPLPHLTAIPANSLVIPMDEKQLTESSNPGNCAADTALFNLKAYGLAQRLLQGNIPLLWAIKAGKGKEDIDFTATAERVFPTAIAAASVDFRGGPFIISAEYVAAATPIINTFRAEVEKAQGLWPANTIEPTACDDGAAARVRVYRITTAQVIDIRHTLTHKPSPVYGAASGGFGGAVHAELFETALITNYGVVNDSTVSAQTCSTIATQPHSDNPAFVSNYRAFVVSGGNLLLQCQSVETYENDVASGHFQTTNGWNTGDENGGLLYPNGDMPFSQFLGGFNDNQEGAVEDWSLNGGSFQNGTFAVIQNDSNPTFIYTATQSKVGNVGRNGGIVFELGGHNYFRDVNNNVLLNANQYNAQRMILNALFVPVTRPENCNVTLGLPDVRAFKSVRVGSLAGDDVNGNGVPNRNDTVVWTIDYINSGSIGVTNFQITDAIDAKLTYVNTPVAQPVVTTNGVNLTTAAANVAYNGTGNLLLPGAFLGVGGRITVEIRTKIKPTAIGDILNQSIGTGTNLPGNILSDQRDNLDPQVNFPPVAPFTVAGNIFQDDIPGLQPTKVQVLIATAAPVSAEGQVVDARGRGIGNTSVSLTNQNTSETRTVMTNSFGFFQFTDLNIGDLYTIGVFNRRYVFQDPTYSFSPNDNVSGLLFVGTIRGDAKPKPEVVSPAATRRVVIVDSDVRTKGGRYLD